MCAIFSPPNFSRTKSREYLRNCQELYTFTFTITKLYSNKESHTSFWKNPRLKSVLFNLLCVFNLKPRVGQNMTLHALCNTQAVYLFTFCLTDSFSFIIGGGSFLAGEDFGRMSDESFPPALIFFIYLFILVEISSRALIPPFRPGSIHRGSAS